MIEDHKEIVAALNNLMETAKPHNKTEEELYSLKKTQVRCKDRGIGFMSLYNIGRRIFEAKII